ncbi:hypothetical protein HRI_004167400 [Hibiscus trionum]|uniref:Uncharacterized protein n=1 Tax=Hibiscus trionum TaxID=183268 RepID=A0A9W7J1J7_HIBTR|nr:hypothetical protein HRI_004167400 [Hibiscus trionum]
MEKASCFKLGFLVVLLLISSENWTVLVVGQCPCFPWCICPSPKTSDVAVDEVLTCSSHAECADKSCQFGHSFCGHTGICACSQTQN